MSGTDLLWIARETRRREAEAAARERLATASRTGRRTAGGGVRRAVEALVSRLRPRREPALRPAHVARPR